MTTRRGAVLSVLSPSSLCPCTSALLFNHEKSNSRTWHLVDFEAGHFFLKYLRLWWVRKNSASQGAAFVLYLSIATLRFLYRPTKRALFLPRACVTIVLPVLESGDKSETKTSESIVSKPDVVSQKVSIWLACNRGCRKNCSYHARNPWSHYKRLVI